MEAAVWLFSVTLSLVVADLDYLKGFDDSVLYKIDWPGAEGADDLSGMESMTVTSHENEKYACYLPRIEDKGLSAGKEYDGPSPIELLTPLFSSAPCALMIDSYWSYELCHGKYIRQFHDTVVGGQPGKTGQPQVLTTEYFLGYWTGQKTKALIVDEERHKSGLNPPSKKIEGVDVPYFQVNYTDGTLCDLTGSPRRTSVLYVCIFGAKSDIFILEEVSTCEYEMIVTRSELCKHPKYRTKQSLENEIKCLPVKGAPQKPNALTKMEAEMMKNRLIPLPLTDKDDSVVAMVSIEEYIDEDGQPQYKVSLKGLKDGTTDDINSIIKDLSSKVETPSAEDFLSGEYCPVRKSQNGVWEYSFCFGHHVVQTLKAVGQPFKMITLGVWDEKAHVAWLDDNPTKRPDPPYSVSYFYGSGDLCPEIGRSRQTEVRLKCTNSADVSLFILEPQECHYIVVIESSMICDFINKLDENGLPQK